MDLYMTPRDCQSANEHTYSRKNVQKYIKKCIEISPDLMTLRDQGVQLVLNWLAGQYDQEKQSRLDQIKNLDLNILVMDVFVLTANCTYPDMFTSVSAQLASKLFMSDTGAAITTCAEILAVIAPTGVYQLSKAGPSYPLKLQTCIQLDKKLTDLIDRSRYLPPMVGEPEVIKTNRDSGYLTHNESVIMGSGNHHNDEISLDVLNILNRTPLKLNECFLDNVKEVPNKPLDTIEKLTNWERFKSLSKHFYDLIRNQAEKFYLVHGFDKRGRAYCHGYNISTQGAPYKKAMIDFANKEYVDVPKEYKL